MASTLSHAKSMILPNPVFEGSEKRLEVDFSDGPAAGGLRLLTRDQLDELMTLAACSIVSTRSNADFDAYVLSESSLFVYPNKWVLKTCGTTRLLNSVPRLLQLTAQLGLAPLRCKYTRASFLFPENQPFPHTGFDDEVEFLDQAVSDTLGAGHSCVLGEQFDGLQWHVYVAGTHPEPQAQQQQQPQQKATFNFEVCMTELGLAAAKQFFRCDKFVSTRQTTIDTGILQLKPKALIDDYVFEPCGYSMNGIEGSSFITIHVTPEPGFSYASVEVSGGRSDVADPSKLLSSALQIFQPAKATVAMTVDSDHAASGFGELFHLPDGYSCTKTVCQKLPGGGSVSYFTMSLGPDSRPGSPTTVLHHAASFLSGTATSDSGYASGSDPETPGSGSETEEVA